MPATIVARPKSDEHAEYFSKYVDLVPEGDILELLEKQLSDIRTVLDSVPDDQAGVLHEPYTWTIKQAVGHLIDVERVFGYRALRFANGDDRDVPGMEQNTWVDNSDYETPSLQHLTDELEYSRRANILFFDRITEEGWGRAGRADGNPFSVRALAYIMAGHIIHHLEIIKSRIE